MYKIRFGALRAIQFRTVKENSQHPNFGGVDVVYTSDLFQLIVINGLHV